MLKEQKYKVFGNIMRGNCSQAVNLLNQKGYAVQINPTNSHLFENYMEARQAMEGGPCAVFDEQDNYVGTLAHLEKLLS